jgi:hypothetical protein
MLKDRDFGGFEYKRLLTEVGLRAHIRTWREMSVGSSLYRPLHPEGYPHFVNTTGAPSHKLPLLCSLTALSWS